MAIVGASLSKRIKLLDQVWLETGIRLGIFQQCGCSSLVYAVFLSVAFSDHGFLIASCRYESWLEGMLKLECLLLALSRVLEIV